VIAHSPTPWRLQRCPDNGVLHIVPAGQDIASDYLCGMPMYGDRPEGGDAAFIVKAVNCHDELLAALKGTLDWLSSFSMPPTSTIEEKQEHMAILEAAIAKAEGQVSPDPLTDALRHVPDLTQAIKTPPVNSLLGRLLTEDFHERMAR
jgi:hypothetical protein